MFRSSRHRFFLVLWWQAAFAFLGGWVGVESMPCVDRSPLLRSTTARASETRRPGALNQ